MNRFIGRIGSAAVALALGCTTLTPALAQTAQLSATYQRQTIVFSHLVTQNGALAIGVGDPGFEELLRATGAVMTWKPSERYVLITTSVPVVVSFAVGDRRYDVGPISLQASFAPFQQGAEVYLPFDEVLRSLDLALRRDGNAAVLQPQLGTLDVNAQGNRVTIVAHGGAPLHPRILQETASAIVYEFDGVGSSLPALRAINAGGVRDLQVASAGTLRDPKTLVTVDLQPGATHEAPHSNDDRDVALGFAGAEGPAIAQAPAPAAALPSNAASPQTTAPQNASPAASPAGPAAVGAVTVAQTADGYSVSIAVSGNATYEWHRLRDPDNRFWVDIRGAALQGPPIDQEEPDPLVSLRVRQIDPDTVRVALSLLGPKTIDVSPGDSGLNVLVGRGDAAENVARTGSGSVGSVVSSSVQQTALVTPAPIGEAGDTVDVNWKFGPRTPQYVPTNPRLIVIDPGHGGSDPGSQHGDLTEKTLTLDMAKRLRDILVSRGWQVQLTRDTDVDVYQPDDSAHDELQARVDVANNAGARMFVSLHANAFINSGPYGTTCYISKPGDLALARMLERHLQSDGTKDDGVIKAHYYVTVHTLMPAVLIETAFLTNPGDYALLGSPTWRQKVAQEIADGIDQYAQAYPISPQAAQ